MLGTSWETSTVDAEERSMRPIYKSSRFKKATTNLVRRQSEVRTACARRAHTMDDSYFLEQDTLTNMLRDEAHRKGLNCVFMCLINDVLVFGPLQ